MWRTLLHGTCRQKHSSSCDSLERSPCDAAAQCQGDTSGRHVSSITCHRRDPFPICWVLCVKVNLCEKHAWIQEMPKLEQFSPRKQGPWLWPSPSHWLSGQSQTNASHSFVGTSKTDCKTFLKRSDPFLP